MSLSDEDEQAINRALRAWRQGDISLDSGLEFIHLCNLSRPHSPASIQVAEALAQEGEFIGTETVPVLDEVDGVVMLSQACDIVRHCRDRPFVEIAPLVEVPKLWTEEIRRLKRPAFAYVPATAGQNLVADLDRIMTVEKALVADWTHSRGWKTDDELRKFAEALTRKRARFAFPDDFVVAARKLEMRLIERHNKHTDEGVHIRALREIRVRAAPSWYTDDILLSWWFIKEADSVGTPVNWESFLERWLALVDQTGRFRSNPPIACHLEDMTARDYIESDRLDLDRLSVS